MKLYDSNVDREYTIPELCREWKVFRAEDPINHADYFPAELHEILMATVNGRNDCEVVDMTPAELNDYILTLRKVIERRGY